MIVAVSIARAQTSGLPFAVVWRGLVGLGTVVVLVVFSGVVYGTALEIGRPVIAALAFAGCYALTLVALVVEAPRVAQAAVRLWPLLLVPAFALLSVIWSAAPDHSLRMGVQLAMSVLIGLVLGAANDPLRLLRLLRLSLLLAVGGSLAVIALGHPMAFDKTGLLSGLFPHKNLFGQAGALLAVASLHLVIADRQPWRSLFGLGVGLAAVMLASSALALVLAVAGGAALLILHGGRGNLSGRALLAAVVLLVFSAVLGALILTDTTSTEAALALLNREATLTGRTLLWHEAWFQASAQPVLGHGYAAFWHPGVNADAVYVSSLIVWWDPGALLLHFHNGYLQVMVDLGGAGLALALFALAVMVIRALAAFGHGGGRMTVWPPVLLLFIVLANLAEYALFKNHELLTLLLVATMASHTLSHARPHDD